VVRAIVVLALFVAVTVVVLSDIHPVATKSTAASSPTTTTTIATKNADHPSTTTTTISPAKVPVLVANASGVSGAAAAVAKELQGAGWDLLPPANASAQVTVSQVYYVAGFQRQAASIASTLQLPATSVGPYTTAAPISSIGTAEVAVVVGPELADQATNPSTTTTAG
jgi:LytR cell envelope-related transcriptional attenuator